MNLDILTTDGSPTLVCPSCLYGDEHRYGLGGSELFLFTLCEAWGKFGHKVRLYNNPHENYKTVEWIEQFPIKSFNPSDNRDVLINFRTPNPKSTNAKGLKVWLSCDQFSNGNYRAFAHHMDKIVCISQTHVDFFKKHYGIEKAFFIDIPVQERDFTDTEKIPNRLIFTSIPDRGLKHLLKAYPLIMQEVPDISLVITSDYRLWGVSPQNEQYRIEWTKYLGSVQFRGAMPRKRYIEELSKADIFLYPCTYQELFCISCAEAQWAGAYPITSTAGALETTNMGTLIDIHPEDNIKEYVNKTVEYLHNREKLEIDRKANQENARQRFSLQRILQEWDEKVFK